jgi:hypothetical protein
LSKLNPSPNVFPKLCEWFSGEGDGSLFESKILVKSPNRRNYAKENVKRREREGEREKER